jgi:hypothetical protein
VYVGGVGGTAAEPELRAAFDDVGVLLGQIEVVMSPATGLSRGFAFVTVDRPASERSSGDDAELLARMGDAVVRGRRVTIRSVPAGLPWHHYS